MFWTAGARALHIAERAPEQRLAIRALEHVPASTVRTPPWRVDRHLGDTAENASVTIFFEARVAPEIVRGTYGVLRAWGALLSHGGFTGGEGSPTSTAVLHQLGEERGREVTASFEMLELGVDGWRALWVGLSRIHRKAPIQRVEMQ